MILCLTSRETSFSKEEMNYLHTYIQKLVPHFSFSSYFFAAEVTDPFHGCQIFLGTKHQKWKTYTQYLQNIPNHNNGYQNYNKIDQHFPFQRPPKYTKIGIFGLQMYHLATLDSVH
jgi:hypothetical protein